jgi:hypothetical protein
MVVLQSKNVQIETLIDTLTQERDEAIAYRDLAVRERGDFAFRLRNA